MRGKIIDAIFSRNVAETKVCQRVFKHADDVDDKRFARLFLVSHKDTNVTRKRAFVRNRNIREK